MTITIFVGPTLRTHEVAARIDAACLPPAAQGDVYHAVCSGARAIGIVDGYFSGAPAVWHKEILWALAQGVPVYGSASMGALRAAELHPFGMRGVGRIFEAFRDGELEDDDEVAVVHGPPELGYLAASEPMVNLRATFARAEAEGVLDTVSRLALEGFSKSLFFHERSWHAVLEGATELGVADVKLRGLREWLPQGRVDQKREDALAMVEAMSEELARPMAAPSPSLRFERTAYWDELVSRSPTDVTATPRGSEIIEELCLEGADAYGRVRAAALLRHFAARDTERLGHATSRAGKQAVLNRWRASLGLASRAALDAWLARNHLDVPSLEGLIDESARAETAVARTEPGLARMLLNELRLDGAYERLASRARQKKEILTAAAAGASPNATELRLWFCEHRLRQRMSDAAETLAHSLGFADVADFDSALRREWLYLRAKDELADNRFGARD